LSGTACYLYEGHIAFNLVASIKSKTGNEDLYKPLFIRVKAFDKINAADIINAFMDMEKAAQDIVGGAVFMLVLVGQEIPPTIKLPVDTEFHKLVVVPENDPFGVSNLVLKTTEQNELSEIYSSHDFCGLYIPINDCLRKKTALTKTAKQ
jgi:hypothetical protein